MMWIPCCRARRPAERSHFFLPRRIRIAYGSENRSRCRKVRAWWGMQRSRASTTRSCRRKSRKRERQSWLPPTEATTESRGDDQAMGQAEHAPSSAGVSAASLQNVKNTVRRRVFPAAGGFFAHDRASGAGYPVSRTEGTRVPETLRGRHFFTLFSLFARQIGRKRRQRLTVPACCVL